MSWWREIRSNETTEDWLFTDKHPDWWTLACSGVCVYISSPGTAARQALINSDLDEAALFLDLWQVAENYVSQACFTFILAIGTSFQRKMWQANPQRGAFLTQWFPMSPTVWGISECRQVKLVYIFSCVYCAVFPPRVFIAELICRLKGNLNASPWQQTFVEPSAHVFCSNLLFSQ